MNKIRYLVVSLFDAFTLCLLFSLPLFPLCVCSRSTTPALGRRPTQFVPTHTLPALSSSTATAAAAVTSTKGAIGRQMSSYTKTTPLPSRRSVGTDEARAAPGSPTHPYCSAVVAKAYEKAKATALRELSESSTRSDHVFNELVTTSDLDTFGSLVAIGTSWPGQMTCPQQGAQVRNSSESRSSLGGGRATRSYNASSPAASGTRSRIGPAASALGTYR